MSKLTGRWIRKNKNVQVVCSAFDEHRDTSNHTVRLLFRNGHVRHMQEQKFLDEFINLDELLAEITEGTRWVNIEHGYSIQVSNVRVRAAAVMYRIDGVAEEYSHGGVDIQRFKDMFKPDLSEETA